MRRKVFSIIAVIFALSLWGCASTGTVSTAIAPTVPLDNFKTLSVNVQTKVENSEKEAQAFKEILIAELKKNNRWKVADNPHQSQLELSATITNMKKVGTTARLIGGALAGRASVDVDVVLKDTNGNLITQFSVEGKSSGGTIFAGTTNQALEKAAEQIAVFMENRK